MVLHRSFLEQLEVMGCWQALIFAYNSFARAPAAAEAQLASAISRRMIDETPAPASLVTELLHAAWPNLCSRDRTGPRI
eukprot:6188272-Pleurochrysis_carterae.AAC.1